MRGRLGQRLYGVGSSSEASFVVGIGADGVRARAYIFCALAASIAGLMIAARIGSGDPQAGSSFTLASVTAVVVGGVSVFGGRGTAIGVLLGAIAVGVMQNALNLIHVSAYYQYVWTGGLTLLAVVVIPSMGRGVKRYEFQGPPLRSSLLSTLRTNSAKCRYGMSPSRHFIGSTSRAPYCNAFIPQQARCGDGDARAPLCARAA